MAEAKVTTAQHGPTLLLRPLILISYSLFYLVPTIFSLLVNLQFKTFFDIDEFKDVWFARFWTFFGPRSRDGVAPVVIPLLENNARGVCLDIGPGSGQWLSLFAKAKNPSITKIYGVEPNKGLHPLLRESAVKAGLGQSS